MQLSIINQSMNWLPLDDKTVAELNGMCNGFEEIKKKPYALINEVSHGIYDGLKND